ncbi:MAG: hypothetical protein JWO06_380 [Bacteroidota bacterium]|nr:hypothetical protein [Bacteroidota bacterium]
MDKLEISEKEMMEALNRSGYLLESEISKILSEAGFFIQTNQVIKDTITGKDREIDLIAEYYEHKEQRHINKCCSKIHFVFEMKNNSAPIVLLTDFEYSPNIDDWDGLKERVTVPENIRYDTYDAFYEQIIHSKKYSIYTQYCSFQRKKANEELMALHPDNIHDGLSKITQYCEEIIEGKEYRDDYLRHFLYLPILLIRDDLYELHHSKENKRSLKKVDSSILVYNYYAHEEPSMAYVFVVTRKGFSRFMTDILELENKIELEMIEKRKNPPSKQ